MRKLLTQLGWDLRMGSLLLALYASGARAEAPMPMDIYGDADKADRLYVLLPGIRDRKDDFRKEGFIAEAQNILKDRKDIALIAVDAHYGYYRDRSVERRLYEDVLRRFPNKRITLVGISLGGFGALSVAEAHPGRVDEILLLSPFLGPDDYVERAKRGDFTQHKGDSDMELRLNRIWPFLLRDQSTPRITLAYGSKDGFVPFYNVLRRQAKSVRFDEIPGKHNWKTWNALWVRWLKQQDH